MNFVKKNHSNFRTCNSRFFCVVNVYDVGTFEDNFLKKGMNFFVKCFLSLVGWKADSQLGVDVPTRRPGLTIFFLPSLVPCRSSRAFPQEFKFWRETDVTLVTVVMK